MKTQGPHPQSPHVGGIGGGGPIPPTWKNPSYTTASLTLVFMNNISEPEFWVAENSSSHSILKTM